LKVLIAPDKFKGTLTAHEVCEAIEAGIKGFDPSIEVIKLPLADGGEGSLDILESLDLNRISIKVHDPLFRLIPSYYCLKNDTAYIEMATASGLQLLNPSERNATRTTTLGTGELILDAINKGATRIYLFIGGSATNDAGIGMAQALGYKFLDKEGNELQPIGANLNAISEISHSLKVDFSGVSFVVATDVKNLLYGQNGAAYVYAVQKGANPEEVESLDNGLKNFGSILESTFNKDYSQTPGAGAAGGIGAGAMAFLNAEIRSGIGSIMKIVSFDEQLQRVDLVITGEGKYDRQTLEGKVIQGVVQQSQKYSKPVGVICGIVELDYRPDTIKYLEPLVNNQTSVEEALSNPFFLVKKRAAELMGNYKKDCQHNFI